MKIVKVVKPPRTFHLPQIRLRVKRFCKICIMTRYDQDSALIYLGAIGKGEGAGAGHGEKSKGKRFFALGFPRGVCKLPTLPCGFPDPKAEFNFPKCLEAHYVLEKCV